MTCRSAVQRAHPLLGVLLAGCVGLGFVGSAWAQESGAAAADAGAVTAPAEPPPPADEIKRVLDYYYNGKARGPALVELKACLKVAGDSKDTAMKNECIEPVTGPVKKNTIVHAWSMWYLPEGGNYDDVSVQFLHENQIRSTIDLRLGGPGRTRTWRSSTLSKPGKWTIKIIQGAKELGSTTVTAVAE